MNYGKLTAGTTKTAIDTAKPSEKGEIITYLSRMGDVLEHITDCGKLIFAPRTVHSVVDSDKMHAKIGKQHIGIKTDLQIIASKTGHILDDNALDFPRLNIG